MARISRKAINDIIFNTLETLANGGLSLTQLCEWYECLPVTVGHARRAGACQKGINAYLRVVGKREGTVREVLETLDTPAPFSYKSAPIRTVRDRWKDYIFLAILRAVAEEEGQYVHYNLTGFPAGTTAFQCGAFCQREADIVRARLETR